MAVSGVPVLILKEGTQRTYGREALRNNILAAKVMAELLKTSLGPRGLDKMLVDAFGDIVVTNDGATIVKEMEVQHPAAKLLVEVAKAQDAEVGDGTTSVVVLAGTLLEKAEKLLDENIHPSIIMSGYTKALSKALEILDNMAIPVDIENEAELRKIVETTLSSKYTGHGPEKQKIIDMVVEAIKIIAQKKPDGGYNVDLDLVKIEKKKGGSLLDSKLIRGVVLDKEVVHPGMPKRVENAKILVLDAPLEIQKPDITTKIRVTDIEQLDRFLEEETRLLKEMVEKIAATGANVVITQKGIDDVAQHFLAKRGILAVRRVKRSDIEKVARATGAKIVTNIDDLRPEDLGEAELVEERKVGEDKMVFIEGAKNPRSVTIVIRGGFERLVEEADRALHDSLSAVADAVMDGKIVAGGGAIEVEIARRLREWAKTIEGKEQLAVEGFIKSLESLPQTLAFNAGHDPIEVLMKLRSAHEEGKKWAGVDIETGEIVDMWEKGVIEPARVKTNAFKAGTEVASLILRIDDVIAAKREETKEDKKSTPSSEED
ncbi:MAG: TCP-1/cpn60 chaperonin family protein [Desulfurococcales archaeon]|nr:TCP-1/cpn60 chaperonin family protein [Desulfurococcales archaeon]